MLGSVGDLDLNFSGPNFAHVSELLRLGVASIDCAALSFKILVDLGRCSLVVVEVYFSVLLVVAAEAASQAASEVELNA